MVGLCHGSGVNHPADGTSKKDDVIGSGSSTPEDLVKYGPMLNVER